MLRAMIYCCVKVSERNMGIRKLDFHVYYSLVDLFNIILFGDAIQDACKRPNLSFSYCEKVNTSHGAN